ncbi:Methyltransferase type 11 domain protein [Rhodopirellula maiorica SM1]|uniref:Methyltransferase type 11 domain protein n=1 Tax=Rhodopirellula maiorica SM1 TaxID=1265738 RepID=M5S2Y1_9BACT|nr:class I SAM-dependent methyltransferase [Rhodopirellula maiorica]EMI20549.1 Methyltransferase type 11 domain protein [Rhodopirellula maiorica SM1]
MKDAKQLSPAESQQLSDLTKERYSKRYQELGKHIRTLGWGSQEQQAYRFEQTLHCGVDFENASVLDIGCGFGDYYEFLQSKGVKVAQYIGSDLNADFIREAKQRYNDPIASFRNDNILTCQNDDPPSADIGIMLGLLNFNWKGSADNLTYSRQAIQNAFRLVKKTLIVDFLSTQLTDTYPKEDFVYYHSPCSALEIGFELTPHVSLKHDYLPIPQREFLLVLNKTAS